MFFKRSILRDLKAWKQSPSRKPLLLQGARQVGKSALVKSFGESFENFIEINFEQTPELYKLFEGNLDPKHIVPSLELYLEKSITPGSTLLFFDELQECPRAITSLRYFYEKMPELHVIGAGSLLQFQIQEEGIPVGRVEFLHLHPFSFKEFLSALGQEQLLSFIESHPLDELVSSIIHQKALELVRTFFIIGGMPEVVAKYVETKDIKECQKIQSALTASYRQDFRKYARDRQIKYVEAVFAAIPRLLGQKFKYSAVDPHLRSKDLSAALELLSTAGIAHMIYHSSGNGVPLGGEIKPRHFKVAFIDIGLALSFLGVSLSSIVVQDVSEMINRGPLAEQFVAQELIAYQNPSLSLLNFFSGKERNAQAMQK